MHQRGDHMLEDHAIGDPLAMTAQRMGRIEWGPVRQQGSELAPDRFQQA
jgi:hypothetical protein